MDLNGIHLIFLCIFNHECVVLLFITIQFCVYNLPVTMNVGNGSKEKLNANLILWPSLKSSAAGPGWFFRPHCLQAAGRNRGIAELQSGPRWTQSLQSWFMITPVITHLRDESRAHLPSTQTSLNPLPLKSYGHCKVHNSSGFPIIHCFVLLFRCLVY